MDVDSIKIGDQFRYYCPAIESKRYGKVGTIIRINPIVIDFMELGTIDLLKADIKLVVNEKEIPDRHYDGWPNYYFLIPTKLPEPKFVTDEKYASLFE